MSEYTENMSKQRSSSTATPRTTVASKVAAMASHASEETLTPNGVSMSELVAELGKQRTSLKEDISALIQESIAPLQASVNTLNETVTHFQTQLNATEALAGDNFTALNVAEKKINQLEEQNASLFDRLDDLENRSKRANLRILNVPEDSERGQPTVKFVSNMLMEAMPGVFDKPPELERAHRSLGQKPKEERPPRPFVVCFHRFQEKEKALRWARANDVKFQGTPLRIYPDLSAALARKRATFKEIKHLLYKKNVRFNLLHPARLRVEFDKQTFIFSSPEEAQKFYDRRVATHTQTDGHNKLIMLISYNSLTLY